jgi:hypothetical protein
LVYTNHLFCKPIAKLDVTGKAEQAGRIGLKPCLLFVPVPLAKANGNEAGKFIAVPFMGRTIEKALKALAK